MKIIRLNDDIAKQAEMMIKADEGHHCCCAIEKNEDTVCMCKEFRDKIADDNFYGKCHCGLYEKIRGQL